VWQKVLRQSSGFHAECEFSTFPRNFGTTLPKDTAVYSTRQQLLYIKDIWKHNDKINDYVKGRGVYQA
jgi:uncharacterized protein (DUF779 family)